MPSPTDDKNQQAHRQQSQRSSILVQAPLVGQVSFGSSWERRWQTLAMFSCSLYFILPSIVVMWALTLYCLMGRPITRETGTPSLLTGLVALYVGFVFVLDKSATSGSRPPLLRNATQWWKYACDYLPLLLVKTAELPCGTRYILGYHPHGIISVGCFGAFATDGSRVLDLTRTKNDNKDATNNEQRGFSSLFPGLDRRVITLPQNFNTPFLREYFLFMGALTSAKETFRTVLQKTNTALVVVVGGAAESLQSQEGTMDLVLEKRKGFVREAILAQASLVPVLGFGENDLYKVYETSSGSWMASFQALVKKWTGLGMPLFQGRSILFQDIGIMPQRKPLVVVVGAPIAPPPLKSSGFRPEIDPQTGEALNEDGRILNEYHAKYMEAIEDLYKTYKDAPWNIPGRDRRKSLAIVK